MAAHRGFVVHGLGVGGAVRAFCAGQRLRGQGGAGPANDAVALIDRLKVDRDLRRICGFARFKRLLDEATCSCAFAQFANQRLAERGHQGLIKEHLGEQLLGPISSDATAIVARERLTQVDDPENRS